jgi:predicted RNase H-like nuclease
VPAQAFGLFAKIRDMDEALARRPELGGRVREVHPEVSFAAWAGAPIAAGKKSAEGRAARAALVDAWLPGAYAAARASLARARAADDDLLDAFAALWTACRIARGEAVTLPSGPPRDLRGLAMEIVY